MGNALQARGAQRLGLSPLLQPTSTEPHKYICAHKCGEKKGKNNPKPKALPAGAAEALLLGLETLGATSCKPASFHRHILASRELQSASEQKETPGTRPHPGSGGELVIKQQTSPPQALPQGVELPKKAALVTNS